MSIDTLGEGGDDVEDDLDCFQRLLSDSSRWIFEGREWDVVYGGSLEEGFVMRVSNGDDPVGHCVTYSRSHQALVYRSERDFKFFSNFIREAVDLNVF